jgi:prephenate dehydratase
MKKIATLGPAGTFSELAAKKYIEAIDKDAKIMFYPTITKVFNAIGTECELGIIPIENTLDGYVQPTLDLLSQTDLKIIYELVVSIQFSFVGNISSMEETQKVYVQFKTQGQCYNFLENITNAKIITTESNGESFEKIKEGIKGETAIVPMYALDTQNKIPFSIKNVTDSEDNETRFIVLSKDNVDYVNSKQYKTSMVIMDAMDSEPGVLSRILNEFSKKNINLTSIISRPTKKGLGKYYFFIDIEGHNFEQENIRQTIEKISEKNVIKVLGSYYLI